MGIEEVRTVYRCPWQDPYCERVIGSIRRECLDRVIILNEKHLCRIMKDYLEYYHHSRPHLFLELNSPTPRDTYRYCTNIGNTCQRNRPGLSTKFRRRYTKETRNHPICLGLPIITFKTLGDRL
ncbi:MAG: integrase core domain-containing protein [Planctomycetota bacterium]